MTRHNEKLIDTEHKDLLQMQCLPLSRGVRDHNDRVAETCEAKTNCKDCHVSVVEQASKNHTRELEAERAGFPEQP